MCFELNNSIYLSIFENNQEPKRKEKLNSLNLFQVCRNLRGMTVNYSQHSSIPEGNM